MFNGVAAGPLRVFYTLSPRAIVDSAWSVEWQQQDASARTHRLSWSGLALAHAMLKLRFKFCAFAKIELSPIHQAQVAASRPPAGQGARALPVAEGA
jgi:hypothetical protein